MLKVHLNNGDTIEVNLQDETRRQEWLSRFRRPDFQARITGMTIIQRGVHYSLSKPAVFSDATLSAEQVTAGKGGERIACVAGDARILLMVHNGQKAAVVSVDRRWRRVYEPRT